MSSLPQKLSTGLGTDIKEKLCEATSPKQQDSELLQWATKHALCIPLLSPQALALEALEE